MQNVGNPARKVIFLAKTTFGKRWYQLIAYDLPMGRLVFILNFKGPMPLKFEKTVFSVLMTFDVT
jgi:hypothetical protein